MWLYRDKPVKRLIEGFDSFVYLIERLGSSAGPKYYIGKKTFYAKNKINGKMVVSESNWQDYYGSSDELNRDVELFGRENFKRHILHFCRTKGDSGYLEIKEQMMRNVLHEDSGYYNKNINSRYYQHPDSIELADNLDFYFNGEFAERDKYWVTNGGTNRLLNKKIADKIVGGKGWVFGQTNPDIDNDLAISETFIPETKELLPNKVSVFKDSTYLHIDRSELSSYQRLGWELAGDYRQDGIFTISNGIEEKQFTDILELNQYLENNTRWQLGLLKDFKGDTFAIDMRTGEKVCVFEKEFNSDEMLTKVSTKRIKVKSKNRIIFQGYITLFFLEFKIPKSLIMRSLKNNGEVILGKYTEFKYSAKYIK